jgi:hypothetical protein
MTQFNKLQPDQDLQCYFERPSAIAAMSQASASGFVLSGTWRQQFDWAVVDWNRDNVFEHHMHRNLPDGDLSGLVLTYDESRLNCIELDSDLYPTVDWPYLRVWMDSGEGEQVHRVKLKDHATPLEGSYSCARATFTLSGILTPGDYIGLAWLDEQYNHPVDASDTLESAVAALASAVNSLSATMKAEHSGNQITLVYVGLGEDSETSRTGVNGNRLGVYGFLSGQRTESWTPAWQNFQGGTSPTSWRVQLDFSDLRNTAGERIPMHAVRKMRWTYSASLQPGAFERAEFQVTVSNWQVTGSGRKYSVAAPGSIRWEESSKDFSYEGSWNEGYGNFSGGSIKYSVQPGAKAIATYSAPMAHDLYLGTRYSLNGADCSVSIDGEPATVYGLKIVDDDMLCRVFLGSLPAGTHDIRISHSGVEGESLYVDFIEAVRPTEDRPQLTGSSVLAVATDWDTDHSLALPAERTAWNLIALGLRGRVNHYVGALVFYELEKHEHVYASATVTFIGTPAFSALTEIRINRAGLPQTSETVYQHQSVIGETAESVAKAFELLINNGSTAIWAESTGDRLAIWARTMGSGGNDLTVSGNPVAGDFTVSTSGFSGGIDGYWRTDTTSEMKINRAARDWSRSFFAKLHQEGLDGTAAFSMELQHGDPSVEAGLAQRYPSGNPVVLTTPALQTNFSPTSLLYWREVYREMAGLMAEAGLTPYLQFGEVQWWYFPYDGSGMPFYDEHTKNQFRIQHGFEMRIIPDGSVDPSMFQEEAAFLAALIGNFTQEIIAHVRDLYPGCRFEVLYPTDVNEGAFNRVVNLPTEWSNATLNCMKTESFTFTFGRDLNKARGSMLFPFDSNFPRSKRSHLIGVSDARSSWLREADLAEGLGLDSVVLFALDQLCLIGYDLPLAVRGGRSTRMS